MLAALLIALILLGTMFMVIGLFAPLEGAFVPTADFTRATAVVVSELDEDDLGDDHPSRYLVVQATITNIHWSQQRECINDEIVGEAIELQVLPRELPTGTPLAFFLHDTCNWTPEDDYSVAGPTITHQVIDLTTNLPVAGQADTLIDKATLGCLADATSSTGPSAALDAMVAATSHVRFSNPSNNTAIEACLGMA